MTITRNKYKSYALPILIFILGLSLGMIDIGTSATPSVYEVSSFPSDSENIFQGTVSSLDGTFYLEHDSGTVLKLNRVDLLEFDGHQVEITGSVNLDSELPILTINQITAL